MLEQTGKTGNPAALRQYFLRFDSDFLRAGHYGPARVDGASDMFEHALGPAEAKITSCTNR